MAGGSVPEVMARLGHPARGAALIYQHATEGRDRALADGWVEIMNALPESVVPMGSAEVQESVRARRGHDGQSIARGTPSNATEVHFQLGVCKEPKT